MATETTSLIVGNEWLQITDGTQSILMQPLSPVRLAIADAKPADDTIGFSASGIIGVTPPTKVWCRAFRNSGEVYVVIAPND